MVANQQDRQLAARLAGGDESALREAYHTYAPAVFGLAARILANPTLAEEVTQDVFVRLWQEPARFDPDRAPLRAYLLQMTHSRAVDRVHAEDSRLRRHAEAQLQPVAPAAEDPERAMVETEEARAVRRALHELPDDQRRAIELAYFDGLSYRAVATALGESEGTVKYRIRAGMQKIRAALLAVEMSS